LRRTSVNVTWSNARKLMVWMPPPEGITMCPVSS
jgi:hypothetical protein